MREKVLELKHVNAYYKDGRKKNQILEDVSFSIWKGDIVGLVGMSGSGKSTLCKAALGLLKEYDGEIVHYTKRPQMVFQDPFRSLNPRKTVGWILEEPLKIRRMGSKEERRVQVETYLEKVHLSKTCFDRYPRELSGGQRQRVSLALALISGARFILADEPLSALDVTVQAQILELLRELKDTEDLSYLFVSHDIDVVSMICNRVLLLQEGHVTEISELENKI
ncbi:MAG: ABC transporter ATP-binding protein [Hespellia sp.]|jgi:ABC-type dipeptide/oligopeptide/nickel transport system ATPase subunit|nr:ABC transporter ATP-binding protein [Hespellia sp.]